MSFPPAIDFGVDVSGGVEDEDGKGELDDGGFWGNKAANESIIAGAVSRAKREGVRTGAGEDTSLAGVTSGSEGIGCRPGDWASARRSFADEEGRGGWERDDA